MLEHYLTAEVSRAAVAENLRAIRARLPQGCRLCAVVKADAYGHGLSVLLESIAAGADALAAATVPEALTIRRAGYEGPVLAMMACGLSAGGEPLEAAVEAVRHGIDLTITCRADAARLHRLARGLDRRPRVHVKVDTGMGRSGVLPDQAPALIAAIRSAEPLQLVGLYTHFAASDEPDKSHAEQQFAVFSRLLRTLGPLPGVVRHAANSAALMDMPHTALDMVRPGIVVYGYLPGERLERPLAVRPVLRLLAPLVQVKRLPAGSTCGYGHDCRLTRDSRVGIVPGGYGDGIPRLLAGKYRVGINGTFVPVLGRISMDQLIVDLTDVAGAQVGQAVTLISPDPSAPNSVASLARLTDTIPYEITCRLGRRVTYKAVSDFDAARPPAVGRYCGDARVAEPVVHSVPGPI